MPNYKKITGHLEMHQQYPATKEELVAECDNLSDFSDEEKMWFKKNLPVGSYGSAGEVMAALNMPMTAAA